MNPHTLRRTLPSALAAAALVAAAAAPAATAAPKITGSGVGAVKIGATYASLRADHLVGKIRHGCELGGDNTRSAPLKAPLSGSVDFTLQNPRKVTNITVRGGATARGVGVGGTIKQIKSAYPKAKVDHSTDHTYEFTLVRIPKAGPGDRLQFAVSTKTHKVSEIGVPFVAVCD
jgi:hypothetical protein